MNVTLCLVKEMLPNCESRSGVRPTRTCNLRVGTVSVGTMSGRVHEVVEILRHCKLDICCLQETRWRGGGPRKIKRKGSF